MNGQRAKKLRREAAKLYIQNKLDGGYPQFRKLYRNLKKVWQNFTVQQRHSIAMREREHE